MLGPLLVMLLLLIPAVISPIMLLIHRSLPRKIIVYVGSFAMIASVAALAAVILTKGTLSISTESYPWIGYLVTFIDAVTLIAILYFGVRLKEWKIIVPSMLQAIAVIYLEIIKRPAETQLIAHIDGLGLVMLLIASTIGPLVAIFALGYMEKHEEHQKNKKSRQNIFFAVIFLFLTAMNAISMADNLMHLYAFWEITTLCSFLLIGHDHNRNSFVSAKRALWLNSVGGLFFVAGIIFIVNTAGTLSISQLIIQKSPSGLLVVGIMFLCCAGFVKSAQLPFQSWLLGAMVAPTPVSALLHSSTMVKAGVYLIVRFSPLFGGHMTGYMVALVGGFTFMMTSALAIGQSNGKRVLAYSTIANLGLIIACAGLGGSAALTAAILLMIYHAVSKGLLFLCMGTVEQGIGSRNIEDMFGIYSKMPFTTCIMALGMVSMVLPPFGVLITKWLALEASVNFPPVLVMIVLGSAFTIAFWVKWLGAILTVYKPRKIKVEKLPFSVKLSLGVIAVIIPLLTAFLPLINNFLVSPAVQSLLRTGSDVTADAGGIYTAVGGFGGILVLLGVLVGVILIIFIITLFKQPKIVMPYACGERPIDDTKGGQFIGPSDKTEQIVMHNYYFGGLFSEKKLVPAVSFISILLILIMFGVS